MFKLKKICFTVVKVLFFKKDVDTEKVLLPQKISSRGKIYKYFIGYFYNDHKVKLLYIMIPKTSAYLKRYDGETKLMHFLTGYDDLLEKYNTISDKVSADIEKEFESEPVQNTKIKTKIPKITKIKTKITKKNEIKSYGYDGTDFYDKEIPNVDSNPTSSLNITFLSQDKLSDRNEVTSDKVNFRPDTRKNVF